MYSSLISKIEKAKRYAEEPERISFRSFEVAFRGETGTHAVSLRGDDWNCECEHFHTSGLCAHVMTLKRALSVRCDAKTRCSVMTCAQRPLVWKCSHSQYQSSPVSETACVPFSPRNATSKLRKLIRSGSSA